MIYVLEHHDLLLELWRRQDRRHIRLAHVDFHDDLRGLLVDRRRQRCYAIGALARGHAALDPGNFLAHAVCEGRVETVRWIHGDPGGRAWDMGIVRYETDLAALHHRLQHRLSGAPELDLAFSEHRLQDWTGCDEGELLSIDWDCFASILLDSDGIDDRVARFLGQLGDTIPEEIYAVYSPEYSHPSLEAFFELVEQLARWSGRSIEWLSPGLRKGTTRPATLDTTLPRDPLRRMILFLRRRGLY